MSSARKRLYSHHPMGKPPMGRSPHGVDTVHDLATARPDAFHAPTITPIRDELDEVLSSGRLPSPPPLPTIGGRTESGPRLRASVPDTHAPEKPTVKAVPDQLLRMDDTGIVDAHDTIVSPIAAPDIASALGEPPRQSTGPRFSSFIAISAVRSGVARVEED